MEKCSQQLGARKRPLSIVVRASCHDVNLIYSYLNYVNQIAKLFIQFISIFLTQEMSNFKCWRSPSNCAIYFMDLGNGHSLYFVVLGETRMKTNDLFIFLNSRLFVNSYLLEWVLELSKIILYRFLISGIQNWVTFFLLFYVCWLNELYNEAWLAVELNIYWKDFSAGLLTWHMDDFNWVQHGMLFRTKFIKSCYHRCPIDQNLIISLLNEWSFYGLMYVG